MSKVALIGLRDDKLSNMGDRPPLGLLYMHTQLINNNIESNLYDLNHETSQGFNLKMYDNTPDIVGISFTTPQYEQAMNMADYFRRVNPNAVIFGGGPHVSATEKPDVSSFNYWIKGKGEDVLLNHINSTDINTSIEELSADRKLLPYSYGIDYNGKSQGTVISSRGCIGSCVFCSRKVHGNKVKYHSVDQVVNDVTQNLELGFNSIYFLDDLFTADSDRVKEISKKIIDRHGKVDNRVTTRADFLDEKTLDALVELGTSQVCLGVEHADNDVLKKNAKGMTIEQNTKIINACHDRGVNVKGFFILNPVGATPETAKKTIEYAKKYCDHFDMYPLTAFPGSRIWDKPDLFGMTLLDKSYDYWEATGNRLDKVNIHDAKNFPADKVIEMINEVRK